MLAKTESLQTITIKVAKRAHVRPLNLSLRAPSNPEVLEGYLTIRPGESVKGTIHGDWVSFPDHGELGIPLKNLESLEIQDVTVARTKA